MAELKRVNRNSFFDLQVERDPNLEATFKIFYVGFEALRSGFLRSCRPIISLASCFLKTQIGGQLLSVIGRDGNNQMFPITWAVVEGENQDSWTWFLERLALDLRITDSFGMTVISDQQKVILGLENAVRTIMPQVEHRNCAQCLRETGNVYVRTIMPQMPGEQLRTTYIGTRGAQFTTVVNQQQSHSTSIANKPDQHQQEADNLVT
ncbi:hypothetical protein Cni_G26064 [Canna indica]|uniref:MULE transposase domain-containing protein n=1 Tax=Canna indica TaxID=4628 RepID=A0AAQ3KZ59_9LILI|nr:hypothetical protein Cni_G26064 [Canna indica]